MNCRYFTILSAFLCLTFEASGQFTLMTKGQASVYDTSVNIRIDQYRAIRYKLTIADSLVAALNQQVNNLILTVSKQMDLIGTQSVIIRRHELTIMSKDSTIKDLNDSFDSLVQENERKTLIGKLLASIAKSPLFLIPASAFTAALLVKTL